MKNIDKLGLVDLSGLSLADLAVLETAVLAERTRRAGKPLTIWTPAGTQFRRPLGGAVLEYRDAVEHYSSDDWYPTVEAAKAALAILAKSRGRVPSGDGMQVDLTAPGCSDTYACVRV